MKKWFITLIFAVSFLLSFYSKTYAAASQETGIKLDGNFADWSDIPLVNDTRHDISSPNMDFQQIRYIADKEYLYLYVSRLSAEKSEPWHFNVVILNAIKGKNQMQYPFAGGTRAYTADFDITTYYINNKSRSETVVNVSFNGSVLESTFSSSDNAKEIEFRIPLSQVGLDGLNKEVEFALKSEPYEDYRVDWLPDRQPILITTGPTGWLLSSIVVFITVSVVAYRIFRKYNIS